MESGRDKPQKALEPSAEQKPKRYRIVKLEERVAPSKGGNGPHHTRVSCTLHLQCCW